MAIQEHELIVLSKVKLRALRLSDSKDLVEIFSDAETMKHWSTSEHKSNKETFDMIANYLRHDGDSSKSMWALCSLEGSKKCIGWLSFYAFRPGICELGYILHRSFWGRGIMTEVLNWGVRDALDRWQIHRIEAQTSPENVSSMRLLEKVGFRREGYLRKNYLKDGVFEDTVLFGLLDEDLMS